MSDIEFQIVSRREPLTDQERVLVPPARRDWRTLISTLIAGKAVAVSPKEVSSDDVKYLTLAIARRGLAERLHTRIKRWEDGTAIRYLWVEHE